jgi:hypothetical protein
MKLGGHRPGSLTSFVDGASGEALLQVAADPSGEPRIAFKLFDCDGNLVSESQGLESFPEGLRIEANSELLLLIPPDPQSSLQYRLYSRDGRLLTCSDGSRTQIYGGLRLDGAKPPSRTKSAANLA